MTKDERVVMPVHEINGDCYVRAEDAAAAVAEARQQGRDLALLAAADERDALREALGRHRSNVWGTGPVGHAEDAALYAALTPRSGGEA